MSKTQEVFEFYDDYPLNHTDYNKVSYHALITYDSDSGEIYCTKKIRGAPQLSQKKPYLLVIKQNYFLPAIQEQTTPELIGDTSSDDTDS